MRRIEADIDGTDTEKRFVARFRAAPAEGVAAHLCNVTAFWSRVAPSTGSQDEAVRHAVVALSAAFQLAQHANEPVIDGFTRDNLDVFAIQHYNKSIERLQRHVGSSAPESVRVTLLCCLAFVSLETLRGNHDVAVTHLVNGLRILQSLPDATFACLADPAILVWPPARDSLQMSDIIQLFARFEMSACFFTHGIQPVVSERGYRARRFDDGLSEGPFADVAHARTVLCCFQHDAMARLHEVAVVAQGGEEALGVFWSNPAQQRQRACLLARSARLGALVADFFSPARFGAAEPDTPELFALYLDLLYFRCAQFLVSRATTGSGNTGSFPTTLDATPFSSYLQTPYPSFHQQPHQTYPHHQSSPLPQSIPVSMPGIPTSIPPVPPIQGFEATTILTSIFNLTARLSSSPVCRALASHHQPTAASLLTDIPTRLLGPLYLVAIHSPDETIRAAAATQLAEGIQLCGEGYYPGYDGYGAGQGAVRGGSMTIEVQRAVESVRQTLRGGLSGFGLGVDMPRALTGIGCLPLMWGGLYTCGVGGDVGREVQGGWGWEER